jgi:hypothetical protein
MYQYRTICVEQQEANESIINNEMTNNEQHCVSCSVPYLQSSLSILLLWNSAHIQGWLELLLAPFQSAI